MSKLSRKACKRIVCQGKHDDDAVTLKVEAAERDHVLQWACLARPTLVDIQLWYIQTIRE
jgi:hypothetical protein